MGSALADVIDNSIAANATTVTITCDWNNGSPAISIRDDGVGMDAHELEQAMRLGSAPPGTRRAQHDLGRFGMGMKTASLSQCRRLTVASKKAGRASCFQWNLGALGAAQDSEWLLLAMEMPLAARYIGPLESSDRGTVVVWEDLDRTDAAGAGIQDFLNDVDAAERHLSMVFHRFLASPARMQLLLNGRAVQPWDPFLQHHTGTWSSPTERLVSRDGVIEVTCYVLPRKDRLTAKEQAEAAGPAGWTAHQGCYVYRNARLLVAGGWLGLGRGKTWAKDQAHQLARIRIDLPNTTDFAWKLDVTKSNARPPAELRGRLTHLAEDVRARARRAFASRESRNRTDTDCSTRNVWRAESSADGIRYCIDDNHDAVRAILEELGGVASQVKSLLRLIEATVPVERLWMDTADASSSPQPVTSEPPHEALAAVLATTYRGLITRSGMSPEQARDRLLSMEPFNAYPQLVRALIHNPPHVE